MSTQKLLKLSQKVNWDEITVKEDALEGKMQQAFEINDGGGGREYSNLSSILSTGDWFQDPPQIPKFADAQVSYSAL